MLNKSISVERVREVLSYDPLTGIITWAIDMGNQKKGTIAGGMSTKGYWQIKIDGILYFAHILIWLGMTGEYPINEIDHKDTNRINNKWENLREATHNENQRNKTLNSNNTSGHKGVY